jgi:ubiquitin-protein ligase
MSISAERIKQDLLKISELSKSVNGRVKVVSTTGNPVSKIILEINYPTAPSRDYPRKVQQKTEVKIELLSRYPFQEPNATITTPVYHPNVYSSGKICFGTKWLPTQGLDLLVRRIIQIITFDETILNEKSPANSNALSWYRDAARRNPEAFPTDKLTIKEQPKKKMAWNNVTQESVEKTIVSCPRCNTSMRVPSGKRLNVNCTKCSHQFLVTT